MTKIQKRTLQIRGCSRIEENSQSGTFYGFFNDKDKVFGSEVEKPTLLYGTM